MENPSLEDYLSALKGTKRDQLEEINLYSEDIGKNIGDEGVRKLFEAIGEKNTSLKKMNLASNEITGEGAILVGQMVERCEAMEVLYLGKNVITDRGCERIAEMMGKSSTLKQLQLWKNQSISDAGAIKLAEALQTNTSLTQLSLSDCPLISDIGAIRLASALEKNTSLTQLHLDDCPLISDKGAIRMAVALERNTSLTELFLQRCGISERGAERLIHALEVNTTLNWLHLRGNTGGMKRETWKRVLELSKTKRTRMRSISPLLSVSCSPPAEEIKKHSPETEVQTLKESIEALKRTMEKMEKGLEGKYHQIEMFKVSEEHTKKSLEEKEKEISMMKKLIEEKDHQIEMFKISEEDTKKSLEEKEKEISTMKNLIEEKDHQIELLKISEEDTKKSLEDKEKEISTMTNLIEEKDHLVEQMKTRIEALEMESVPTIQTSFLSFSPLPSLSINQDGTPASAGEKEGFLCHLGSAKVRVRMLNAEEWSKGVQKWFRCSQRHPFIPRVLGIVHKKDIPLVEGNEHILPHLHDDVDGIAILDASTMGKFTLYDLLHGSECGDDDGHSLDLHAKSVILSVLIDVAETLRFVHDELGMIHGSVNSHSILVHYSKEEGRIIAQLSEVGMWSRSMLNDDRIRWVAPELIASGGSSGPSYESDIWSFGMMMEEMLTGELPFESKEVIASISVAICLQDFETHPHVFDSSEFEELMNACRHAVADQRPHMHVILNYLKNFSLTSD